MTGYNSIHPALPWYLRQLFEESYPAYAAESALCAWVEAMGILGHYYHSRYEAGNRGVIAPLTLGEANLLHARRTARRHGWWEPIIWAMQGLRVLYEYQGRTAEWASLVTEIVPEFCTADDDPLPGREGEYSVVMDYRVRLARDVERDLPRAAALQEKVVAGKLPTR